MHKAIYEKLKDVARKESTVYYSEIAPLAGLDMSNPADRNRIAEILGDISTYEHDNHRPMLSAVVILQDSNKPGKGFFTLAKELGLYAGSDDDVFFSSELTKVHAAWQGE